LSGCRNCANLLYHAQKIRAIPAFEQLAVDGAEDGDPA
jgi:hypothetical protein